MRTRESKKVETENLREIGNHGIGRNYELEMYVYEKAGMRENRNR